MSILSRTASSLDRRFGWALPKPIAILTLVGLRTRLRHENLYDTETVHPLPPAGETPERARAPAPGRSYNDPPRLGWARSAPASAGTWRRTHLPGRAARHPRAESSSAASSSRGGVHPGDDAEPPRGRVAPVRGARLVQPRQERGRTSVGGLARRGGRLGRGSDAHPANTPRPDLGRRPDHAADVRHGRQPLVGRVADLRERAGIADALRSGESGKIRVDENGLLPQTSSSTSTSRAWPATSGSGSASSTRSSRSSTTRSATRSRPTTCPGTTSGSTTPHAS